VAAGRGLVMGGGMVALGVVRCVKRQSPTKFGVLTHQPCYASQNTATPPLWQVSSSPVISIKVLIDF
jgi:hypothetical protein